MADDDLAEAIRLSLASAQDEVRLAPPDRNATNTVTQSTLIAPQEKRRKQAVDEEEALKAALKLSVDESPVRARASAAASSPRSPRSAAGG